MDWNTYKENVETSREVIVFPFFESHFLGREGAGVDLGCGTGDLTNRVSKVSKGAMVGVDANEGLVRQARMRSDGHFVAGDLTKNFLPSLGFTFDYAYSNCCLCHLSDAEVSELLLDLYGCMRPGAEFVFLVPSPSWAKRMYKGVRYEKSGLSAIPRFGGRQQFRMPEWYKSVLERSGFELLSHCEITIPDDERLDPRYLQNVGEKLFSAFIARRRDALSGKEVMVKAFEIAHDNRKLEIQLFWQRSLFFWGFVAAALVAFGVAYNAKSELTVVLALFGLVCSIVWSAGNRGSKYWQQYWEEKVNHYQQYVTGNIFYDRLPRAPGLLDNYAPRRISVSKLTMALSDYAVAMWLVLCAHSALKIYGLSLSVGARRSTVVIVLLTLLYCLFFLRKSESED